MQEVYKLSDVKSFSIENSIDFSSINLENFSKMCLLISSLIENIGYKIGRYLDNQFLPSIYILKAYKNIYGRELN